MIKKFIKKHWLILKTVSVLILSGFLIVGALALFWVSTFKVPTSESIQERRVSESTKIYDRTGQILLYDTGGNVRRSTVPITEISRNIKNATIAIEDKEFYSHNGVKPTAFIRATLVNILSLDFSQGGSTITQQVIKNSLLTSEKLISRKIKEWVLAIKLEQVATKDEILSMYLNEIPYGGVIYGVEEASQTFFGKKSSDVTLAEAAYLAALPKAPTFYSPYGKNKNKLEERKNLVLREMLKSNFITKEEYDTAIKEKITFIAKGDSSIKAPHFVFYVIEYIKNKYGEEAITTGGLRVTTSLNYDLQSIGEKIALDYAKENKIKFDAENTALVAIDPKNGEILTMVGSRDYFDKEIDGAFNVTLAKRQPGSTIKPFVYSEVFIKGYTPETVLFDLKTQFSTNCAPDNLTMENSCYAPENYDGLFRGPITLRNALAQSINVPSVKVLYLAGLSDSIRLARDMGIESLSNKGDYGLTLVLGGGEVTPLELTSAYGVFANNGVKNKITSIIEIKNKAGVVLEKSSPEPVQVLDKEVALKISSILSDNVARAPSYGQTSALYFGERDVAVKTGTTNNYKDAWIMGYTPNIAVGAWAGNNDNTPMQKKVAGFIVAPLWRAFMDQALNKVPNEQFEEPLVEDKTQIKPVLQGIWQGGIFDPSSNYTTVTGGVHSILNWVNKDDPRGPYNENPSADPQFERWERSVRIWAQDQDLSNDLPYRLN
ncbi:MAG: transglycosylase domain-containing protein [Candidatus Paceibacterota bacterium]|jgi:1A family penicillin-binding protein